MTVCVLGFTRQGAGAAVIVRQQGRPPPVVIAHWSVNIAMSSPTIVFPRLRLVGVLPVE